jgi:hypothetical protein
MVNFNFKHLGESVGHLNAAIIADKYGLPNNQDVDYNRI